MRALKEMQDQPTDRESANMAPRRLVIAIFLVSQADKSITLKEILMEQSNNTYQRQAKLFLKPVITAHHMR